MKQLLLLLFCGLYVVLLSGCQGPQESTSEDQKTALPPEIAGTWKARESSWKIVLNPDGTVYSAVIPMGTVEVKPNQVTKVEMKDGQFSTYKAGDCGVEYAPETRELYVCIEMDEIHIVFLDESIDGNSLDRFVGPVSEDGKVWTADHIAIFNYGPRFPQDPNDIYAELMIFDKVKD